MRFFENIVIPANGSKVELCAGKVLTIKKSTLPIVAVIGADSRTVKSGSIVDTGEFTVVNFLNGNAVPVTLSYWIGEKKGDYTADDNSSANAGHYAFGNLGVAIGAAAANGLPACNANGFLQITNAMQITVSGVNNGHRRHLITINVDTNSPAPLNIVDVNGNNFRTLQAGQDFALPTDATFVLSGAGGTANASIGELYLANY